MHPFHPPRPSAAQSHHPRPGDPGRPPFLPAPMHQQQMNPAAFQPPGPGGFGAFNPMAAVAAANPFLAMQLFSQAQQLQNLGNLAAALQQQQQQQQQHHHQQQPQQQPFFPGGFPPNPNQFGAFQGPQAGFNGGGAFRPGGPGFAGSRPPLPSGGGVGPGGAGLSGSRPPLSMMSSAAGNSSGGGVVGPGLPRPGLNVDGKDRNIDGRGSQVNHPNNKSNGASHAISENDGRNNTTDQRTRFNPGTDGRNGRQFGPSGGRGRGDGRGGKQFSPSGGRGRGDARDGRQFGPSGGRGRGRNLNQGRGRGRNDRREGKPNFMNNDSPTSGGRHIDSPSASEGGRKRPPIIYDKNEVRQWIQARKKNYPTSVNVNKKLSQSKLDDQKKDEEAQMRRRELKEVLAKQKELGFELPELPPGYLSETEGQPREPRGNEKESRWRTQQRDSRFGNRGARGNKRPRNNDRRDFQSKRPREWNPSRAMVESREPTLLQKLYGSDIKRDRHRLLHTFKFMAQNNFFKDWPDKPLEFPSVTVNQIELDFDIDVEDLDDDDDLPDAETAKDSSLDLKENVEQQDSSSSDEEAGSKDGDEADEDDDDDTDEDADSEECDASEEEFSA